MQQAWLEKSQQLEPAKQRTDELDQDLHDQTTWLLPQMQGEHTPSPALTRVGMSKMRADIHQAELQQSQVPMGDEKIDGAQP